ncbi:MAG TPA: 50S ribosomal protein L22 [Planctomycetota bacterium]|nr:50S ribosomal protein L22 [Planctomycetota bacterium]
MSFEVRAVHRGARMGVYKARRILALIRGISASAALDELRHERHRASRTIYKVLASAVANALQNPDVRANRLVVSKTFAQDGPLLPGGMRMRPGPQGRAMPIKRRTCHIHVHVADPQAAPMGGAAPADEAVEAGGAEE